MKIGYASAILPDQSFEYVVDAAQKHNFKCVEMMCWPKGKAERRYAGVTHIDVNTLDNDKIKYIKDYLTNRQIEISSLGYYPNPLDNDLKKRNIYINHIKKLIENAPKLGVENITTFIGRDPKKSVSESLKDFKSVWVDIIKHAEDNGVKVAIENCPMFFTMDEWPGGKNLATTPKIWSEMFDIIKSDNFGLNYDPSHFIWQQMDYIKPVYDFKDKLFHLHIKDHKLYPEKLDEVGIMTAPLDYSSPKLPGLGDVDWGEFISALTDIKYDGYICIEVEDKDFEDTLEKRLEAIGISKKYIDQFII